MEKYLSKLNKAQYEAATTIYGPTRILAGAGSGKTTVLIARVAYLLENGISPENILLVTFTNKAAKEMQERVISLIGEKALKITACTYHSFCANILRRNIHLLGINNNFNIIDSADVKDIISIARQEFLDKSKKLGHEYDLKDFPSIKTIAGITEWCINSCVDIDTVIKKFELNDYSEEIKKIIGIFTDYKKKRDLLDYDDLLYYTKIILESFEYVRHSLDEHYQYIMVDEFQDSSNIQSEIMNLLVHDFNNYCVCGDDQQSIYSWRCAEIKNIIDFDRTYPECKTIILNENYRSSQEILNFANAVMKYAKEGIPKKLHGQFSGEKPKLVVTNDNREEYNFILNKINELHNNGIKYNNMAVMIRNANTIVIKIMN